METIRLFFVICLVFVGYVEMAAQSYTRDSVCHYFQLAYSEDFNNLRAIDLCKKALAISETLMLEKEKAVLYEFIYICYLQTGDFPSALQYLQKSKSILASLNLKYEKNKYWLDSSRQSLNRCDSISFTISNLISNYIFEGDIYFAMGDYKTSTELAMTALDLFKNNNDSLGIGLSYNHLGKVEIETGNLEKAVNYLEIGQPYLAVYPKEKDYNLTNLGVLYLYLNKYEKALKIFKQSLTHHIALKNNINIARMHGNIAYAYGKLQAYDQAFKHYKKSIAITREYNFKEVQYVSLFDLAEMYEEKGDFKKALATYKNYRVVRDTVVGEKAQAKIKDLEVKYETAKKERALIETQKEVITLEQQAQIRTQRMGLILGSLIASLLIAILIFFKGKSDLRNKEIQEKLMSSELKNKELEAKYLQTQLQNKTSDLTNLSLEITRKNEFSETLKQRLEKLEGLPAGTVKQQLQEIGHFVSSNLEINEDLSVLQSNIAQVNQQFYTELSRKYTDLTQNELNLCGLIRLNFSNKEIALVKNVSLSSAKMSRYRIRKKLGLASNDNIVSILREV